MYKNQTSEKSQNAFYLNRMKGECYYTSVTADFNAPAR